MLVEACNSVERAQLWLGTLVSVRVSDMLESAAHNAISQAFSVIARLHRCMSFHDPNSDISRLNRAAHLRPLTVQPDTFRVLTEAERFARCSEGTFDITVAHELSSWQYLPALSSVRPDPEARWSDIELLSKNRVRFHRPLWIDLGGIAKGFAVDSALARLQELGVTSAVVNAGGDLRVCGTEEEIIGLKVPALPHGVACVSLKEGSLASSCGSESARLENGLPLSVHVDGCRRTAASQSRFVCVAAQECITADALTKVVLANGLRADKILSQFHAQACLFDEGSGWSYLRTNNEDSSNNGR